MSKYLTAKNLKQPARRMIRELRQEMVDGVPQLVLYFKNHKRPLILTRETAMTLTRAYGRHPLVDKFFNLN